MLAVLQAGLILLLAMHLAAVNVAAGGPFVCLWLERRARRGDRAADLAGRQLARWSLDAIAFGVLLGVALIGLFWWLNEGTFLQALGRIEPRRIAFGGVELMVYYLLMAWYLASWGTPSRGTLKKAPWVHPLIAFVAGTNLVYHFPTLFIVVAIMAERGPASSTPAKFVSWLGEPELLARVGHFCLASLAVTGGALLWQAGRLAREQQQQQQPALIPADIDRIATWGTHLMLWPTLAQLPLGLFVLLRITERSRDSLLGGDWAGTALFGAALLGVFALIYQLAIAVIGRVQVRDAGKQLALLGLVILLMVGARQRSRQPLHPPAGKGAQTVVPAETEAIEGAAIPAP